MRKSWLIIFVLLACFVIAADKFVFTEDNVDPELKNYIKRHNPFFTPSINNNVWSFGAGDKSLVSLRVISPGNLDPNKKIHYEDGSIVFPQSEKGGKLRYLLENKYGKYEVISDDAKIHLNEHGMPDMIRFSKGNSLKDKNGNEMIKLPKYEFMSEQPLLHFDKNGKPDRMDIPEREPGLVELHDHKGRKIHAFGKDKFSAYFKDDDLHSITTKAMNRFLYPGNDKEGAKSITPGVDGGRIHFLKKGETLPVDMDQVSLREIDDGQEVYVKGHMSYKDTDGIEYSGQMHSSMMMKPTANGRNIDFHTGSFPQHTKIGPNTEFETYYTDGRINAKIRRTAEDNNLGKTAANVRIFAPAGGQFIKPLRFEVDDEGNVLDTEYKRNIDLSYGPRMIKHTTINRQNFRMLR